MKLLLSTINESSGITVELYENRESEYKVSINGVFTETKFESVDAAKEYMANISLLKG